MNRNTLWAQILLDELARAGVRHICIAPGSRSTALTLAAAEHPNLECTVHLDERSAAFFALGLAVATQRPVVLICTSGSAAANFFPAIIEARQSRIPLIVLTSDRPHELRYSGANQTIDQLELYGKYALWSVDVALPEQAPSALSLRNLRTLANRAVAVSNGLPKGVVHLNVPFRKPLEPTPVPGDQVTVPDAAQARVGALTRIVPVHAPAPGVATLNRLAQLIADHPKGVIICGPNLHSPALVQAITSLAATCGYPVLADPLSNLRFTGHPAVIGSYDSVLTALPDALKGCTLALRFGDVPTSQALNTALTQLQLQHYLHITSDGIWTDDSHLLSDQLTCDPVQFCELLTQHISVNTRDYLGYWQGLEALTWQHTADHFDTQPFFDAIAVYDTLNNLPKDCTVLFGNSLPVRHADQFGRPQAGQVFIHGNRGASGIDGNISTALGMGYARYDYPLIAILGDITFYHDMNGLLASKLLELKPIIILLNNGGGGIFERLPVRNFEPHFTPYFLTPHNLDFAHSAALYGLAHTRVTTRNDFQAAFNHSVGSGQASLIEVMTDAKTDLHQRQRFITSLRDALKDSG
jgi:2-succinyl-5-enolpyruvyl-6-hydroxy-3-cyclohexene-1-carboxylate synthase